MMAATLSVLSSLPNTQLRRNRYFYLLYDGFYAAACIATLILLARVHPEPFLAPPAWALAVAFPVACHLLILAHAWIHNATHNNFPRPINRLVGEILGAIVITRFASWEIVHQRHHRYSDDRVKDPHPVQPSYWRYVLFTIINVEKQLQQVYFDLYGDTPENRAFERKRAWVSYLSNVVLLAVWYRVLGPLAFFAVFVPANLIAALHVIHFNWSTHNGFSPTEDFHPVNLDHGYYWVGNRIWHGIYFHANHHRKANVFNPMHLQTDIPLTPAPARSS